MNNDFIYVKISLEFMKHLKNYNMQNCVLISVAFGDSIKPLHPLVFPFLFGLYLDFVLTFAL
jgi:hypothetical protein